MQIYLIDVVIIQVFDLHR